MSDILEVLLEVLIILAVIVVIVGAGCCLFAAVHMRLTLPGSLAAIEQLRSDVLRVGANQSEDAVGQATEWNQAIANNKAYNRIWWSDWMVPDAWNAVQPIEIPGP